MNSRLADCLRSFRALTRRCINPHPHLRSLQACC